jgi:hypothetical protein
MRPLEESAADELRGVLTTTKAALQAILAEA